MMNGRSPQSTTVLKGAVFAMPGPPLSVTVSLFLANDVLMDD